MEQEGGSARGSDREYGERGSVREEHEEMKEI